MLMLLFNILFILCIAGSIGSAVYWIAVFVHVKRTAKILPTARDGILISEQTPPSEHVCVVVPCHNEAGCIATLIHSLKDQDYDRLRVVLALDRCTDDTLGVAREAINQDPRFEIVEVTHCPDGWAGKVHAAYTGYHESTHAKSADVLLFTDADTWLDRACIRSCIALLNDRSLSFLSLLSTLTSKRWYERLVQPVTAFELARQYPLLKVNGFAKQRRAFANGQFMMFRSQAYREIDGHEGVKQAILEDIAFARVIERAGFDGGLLIADDMLRCQMYDNWEEYKKGWKRIYTESANREVRRLKRYARRTPGVCAGLPLLSLGAIVFPFFALDSQDQWIGVILGSLGFVGWIVGMGAVYKMSRARLIDLPGAFIGAFLTGRIFAEAAMDLKVGNPTQWGGKSYVRQAEDVV